eukprot:scaffold2151_cov99-Isochrysis_galbana.AAC.13
MEGGARRRRVRQLEGECDSPVAHAARTRVRASRLHAAEDEVGTRKELVLCWRLVQEAFGRFPCQVGAASFDGTLRTQQVRLRRQGFERSGARTFSLVEQLHCRHHAYVTLAGAEQGAQAELQGHARLQLPPRHRPSLQPTLRNLFREFSCKEPHAATLNIKRSAYQYGWMPCARGEFLSVSTSQWMLSSTPSLRCGCGRDGHHGVRGGHK